MTCATFLTAHGRMRTDFFCKKFTGNFSNKRKLFFFCFFVFLFFLFFFFFFGGGVVFLFFFNNNAGCLPPLGLRLFWFDSCRFLFLYFFVYLPGSSSIIRCFHAFCEHQRESVAQTPQSPPLLFLYFNY